jgi:integrase/recombinase XerC
MTMPLFQSVVRVEPVRAWPVFTAPSEPDAAQVLSDMAESFVKGLSPKTLRGYRDGLDTFARHLAASEFRGVDGVAGVAWALYGRWPSDRDRCRLDAHRIVNNWRASMRSQGLANNTIRSRLVAVRALHKLARTMLAQAEWDLRIPLPPKVAYADTRGCGMDGFIRVFTAIKGVGVRARRDRAILALMFHNGFRRGEVGSLDVEHLDLGPEPTAMVHRKKRAARTRVPLAAGAVPILRSWLDARGWEPGPLFVRLDRCCPIRARLGDAGLYRVVVARGLMAGVKGLRPHKLRHAAITAALEAFGGDVVKVMDFSGHADLATLQVYNDNRGKSARQVADAISAQVEQGMAASVP